jgi:2,3-bisphosphoglycerate-independent phosphoglycerate mutase
VSASVSRSASVGVSRSASGGPRLLFLFLDGVGLGADDPAVNPFAAARTPVMADLLGGPLTASRAPFSRSGVVFGALETGLGVPGLPQSATGQASLLTGVNAAQQMGRHYGPWPGPTVKRLLDGGTLFSEAHSVGAALANVYPPGYFAALSAGKQRVNVPVYAAKAAGLPLLTLEDYRAGRGVSVDLSGGYLSRFLPEAGDLTPAGQGRRLARMARLRGFTFFDFWPTDHLGHRGSLAEAVGLAEDLDSLLGGVLEELGDTTLLVTSDHGNLEDMRGRAHTHAPAPLLAVGPQARGFAGATSLQDVAPRVRALLGLRRPSDASAPDHAEV